MKDISIVLSGQVESLNRGDPLPSIPLYLFFPSFSSPRYELLVIPFQRGAAGPPSELRRARTLEVRPTHAPTR